MKRRSFFVLLLFIITLNKEIFAQQNREIEIKAQEILARADDFFKYPSGALTGVLKHIYPTGKTFELDVNGKIAGEDFLFTLGSKKRGDHIKILFNQGGEDIWVYNLLSIKLYRKKLDIGRYEPLLQTNYTYLDFSNADLQSNYLAKIDGDTVVRGKKVLFLTLNPIFKQKVDPKNRIYRQYQEYGKLVLYVTQDKYFPVRIDYYDRDKVLIKTMTIAQIATFDKRVFPVRYDMFDIKSGTLTILKFTKHDAKQTFDKKIFRHESFGK